MKISLNWLKKYVNVKIPDADLIRLIGARLVEVEGVIDETHKYDKIYVVKVEKAEKIPDTHLTLCQINTGGDELVQVVCGAPNVREGMLAAWIAPGAIVPASVKEDAPFVIGKRRMLGKYDSNGMLAGADELDFGDDHSGIVEIDPEKAQPGELLADVFELNDLILEIENKSLTHRPDCFGLIGFAREVYGILGENDEPFAAIDFADQIVSEIKQNSQSENNLEISILDNDICDRYTAVILRKHGDLKKKYLSWIDTILAKSGMRPVDSIVDATNYLMLLTGQPLHAFDYDKFVKVGGVDKPKIVVRLAKAGEKLTLIDDKEVELSDDDIVITSNDIPVALAGAMGGKTTEIDENTKNIILESATFSLYNLRRTQMRHGIFSEAITRFTKGQPPYQTLRVAKECADMLSDGFRVSEIVDKYVTREKEYEIKIKPEEINNLLGTKYSESLMIKTLENVDFKVEKTSEGLKIKAPDWRTDIHIKEDIIEEIGRLLGYDNILPTLPKHSTAEQNKMFGLKRKVREEMLRFGANELLTYSFVSERLLEKALLDVKNSYKIVNSISPDLQYVRQSIVPSLLEKAYINQKIPFDKFALYEINKVYQKAWGMDDEGVPVEKMQMGFVLAERKNTGIAYYKAKMFVEKLLNELGIQPEFLPIRENDAKARPFEKKRTAEIWFGGVCLGVVGEFKNSVRNNFKLEPFVAGFELDLDVILQKMNTVQKIERFEVKKKEDITITTTDDYATCLQKLKVQYPEANISPVSIYQPEGEKNRNITFHLEFY